MTTWQSMTGFAEADWIFGNNTFRINLKAVNHRFFEARLRLPKGWASIELSIKNLLKTQLVRGSIEFWIDEIKLTSPPPSRSLNERSQSILENFSTAMQTDGFQLKHLPTWGSELVKAALLISKPDLWLQPESRQDESALCPDESELVPALELLCQKLRAARIREGQGIRAAVQNEIALLRQTWQDFDHQRASLEKAWKATLDERLRKLCAELTLPELDPQRVYQEFVVIAEKRDVAEEIQRIDSHLGFVEGLLQTESENDSMGKQLEFWLQELNREWTTLSNKIQTPSWSKKIGIAKMSLEKIREQAHNLA